MFFVIIIIVILILISQTFLHPYKGGGDNHLKADTAIITDSVEKDLYNEPNTVYNVGSISKTFTSYLCGILLEKKLLNFDKSANKYLKSWKLPSDDITVRMLLHHSSGLSNVDIYGYPLDIKPPTLTEILNGTKHLLDAPKKQFPDIEPPTSDLKTHLENTPGKVWKYASINYVVLQLLLEDLTNSKYADLVKEYIFEPLHMSNSTFNFDEVSEKIATPHWKDESPIPHYHFSEHASAGLYSTMNDMIIWVKELMKPTLINNNTWTVLKSSPTGAPYGLGFELLENSAVAHKGTNWGWKSYISASPHQATVYLSNWQGEPYLEWLSSLKK
jgi:CubicO group peptidase (beta-lactamase class C family)